MTSSMSLLLVEDDKSLRSVIRRSLSQAGFDVQATDSLSTLWLWLEQGAGEVLLTDVGLPDGDALDLLPKIRALRPELPVIVMSANNTMLTALRSGEQGAFDYLSKPFDLNLLIELCTRAVADKKPLVEALPPNNEGMPIVGRSAPMQDLYRVLARLTGGELTVLIRGESGTGKELVAQALHRFSRRAAAPFLALNMAALPTDLIEAELFGYEKGAFTGAGQRKQGYFERADGGTLFLDEIGDMPIDAQTRLLRVLQDGRLIRVGGNQEIDVDVRILAATHKNLEKMVEEGRFREDLFYRLNVVPIALPPLRDRAEDIPDLVQHMVHRHAQDMGLEIKYFDADALAILTAHAWPGNVRELENLVLRALALTPSRHVSAEDVRNMLPASQGSGTKDQTIRGAAQELLPLSVLVEDYLSAYERMLQGEMPPSGLYQSVMREVEAPLLRMCLRLTGGNQLKAAALLGLNRNTLRKKISDLQLELDMGSVGLRGGEHKP